MLVRECMTETVELTDPSMKIVDAARKMRDGDFGLLPVGENDRLVGMITDRDITIRLVAEGKDPEECTVGDVMSPKVLYCFEDQDTSEVARNMGENQVRRLPVLSREKRLVGIISLGDIALASSGGEEETTHEALREISQPGGDDQGPMRRSA